MEAVVAKLLKPRQLIICPMTAQKSPWHRSRSARHGDSKNAQTSGRKRPPLAERPNSGRLGSGGRGVVRATRSFADNSQERPLVPATAHHEKRPRAGRAALGLPIRNPGSADGAEQGFGRQLLRPPEVQCRRAFVSPGFLVELRDLGFDLFHITTKKGGDVLDRMSVRKAVL